MKSNVVCTLVWSRSNSVRRGSADCRVHRPGPTYGGQGSARTARTGLGTRPHPQSWRRTQAGGKKTPEVISRIEELMRHDTAGDPITGVKWSRRRTRKMAAELTALGIAVSKNTVGRLLKQMDFKLRVNRKQIASTKNPERNQQFLHIGEQRERFVERGLPIISVDTKKKELIGNFKNAGAKWDREPILVKDHDFRSEAEGMALLRKAPSVALVYDWDSHEGDWRELCDACVHCGVHFHLVASMPPDDLFLAVAGAGGSGVLWKPLSAKQMLAAIDSARSLAGTAPHDAHDRQGDAAVRSLGDPNMLRCE